MAEDLSSFLPTDFSGLRAEPTPAPTPARASGVPLLTPGISPRQPEQSPRQQAAMPPSRVAAEPPAPPPLPQFSGRPSVRVPPSLHDNRPLEMPAKLPLPEVPLLEIPARPPLTPREPLRDAAPVSQPSPLSIADVYLSSEPVAKVNEASIDSMGEIGPDGRVASAFPPAPPAPAPTQRPRFRKLMTEMPSLGILDALLADESIHDILITGTQPIYVDRNGQIEDSGLSFATQDEVWQLAERMMESINQRWHPDRPMIDTRLPDGSRVNIVAPPMAVDGVSISIRKFPTIHVTLDSMVEQGQLSMDVANFLKHAVNNRVNIIVAGGTSSGKTTLLNALSAAVSPRERIVTIEDSAELRLQQPHVVRLEAKPAIGSEAPESAVTIRDLVKNALRMRPDRIIVGESRGEEALDVLQAMNTGHDGSMTSLHANSPRDALGRLETMVSIAMPQLTSRVVRGQIASTVNLMVQMARSKDGQRRITHISEIAGMEGEMIMMQDLITYNDGSNGRPAEYRWVGGAPRNQNVTDAARQAGMLRGLR